MPGGAPSTAQRIDQFALHRALFNKSQGHILPQHVGSMTLAEIATVLDDTERGPGGAPALTDAQVEAEQQRWARMTPAEMLRNYQR